MSEQKNEDFDFQKVVDSMVDSLKKSGLNVAGAALLKVDDNTKSEDINSALGASLKKVYGNTVNKITEFPINSSNSQINKASEFIKEIIKRNEEVKGDDKSNLDKKEICYCSNCFNFNTFEEVLNKTPGGVFDYTEFKVGGKNFIVKHWRHTEQDKEQLMIEAKEDYVPTNKEIEIVEKKLENSLIRAIADRDYEEVFLLTEKLKDLQSQKIQKSA